MRLKKIFELNEVIRYIKKPRNYVFLIVVVVCTVIALRKYDYWDILKVVFFALVFGIMIRLIFFRR